MSPSVRYGLYALLSGTIVLLDQWTKALVQQRMHLMESIPVIPHVFNLTYIRNPGAAFGLFVGMNQNVRGLFFLVITGAAIVVIGYFFVASIRDDFRHARAGDSSSIRHNRWLRFGLALVLGGAIGNLIDRMRYGEVVDFLDFYLGPHHWPAFNVADSSITVGVTILLVAAFFLPNSAGASHPTGRFGATGAPPSPPPTA
jgi:signal peptidase II